MIWHKIGFVHVCISMHACIHVHVHVFNHVMYVNKIKLKDLKEMF